MITQNRFHATSLFLLIFLVLYSPSSLLAAGGENQQDVEATGLCDIPGEPCLLTPENPGASIYRQKWKDTDNPAEDGWDTEVFNGQADQQLKKLSELLLHSEEVDPTAFIDKNFRSTPLRPTALLTVFEDKSFTVKRSQPDTTKSPGHHGIKGFHKAIEALTQPLQQATDLHAKFKTYRVAKKKDQVTTHQYFAISGFTSKGMYEQNATWRITWKTRDALLPVIVNIEIEAFEEITGHNPAGRLLRDSTESVLGSNRSYEEQILHGYPEFLGSIENTLEFSLFGTPGIALGDVNNDGLDDIYICQEQGLPNRLYIQEKDGTARDISEEAGVDWLESSRSALFLDLDNDLDQDLVVAMPGALVLAENSGKGKFAIKNILPLGDDPMSLAGADYDLDGDVDLYVTLYNPNRQLEKTQNTGATPANQTFVYHDANNGPANILFRNDIISGQKWTFTDVTSGSGLDANNSRFSLSAAWEDYDNDGDQDLYVANDYGRDNLYRNDTSKGGQPQFVDVSSVAAIEDSAGSMAITWGDYNRDGLMDAFISAMWSSAGNRITYQDNFKTENGEVKSRLQQFARGNTLLLNAGNSRFTDKSSEAGIEMGRWAWASNFADINNDGWEDLLIANGFLTGDQKGGDL